MNTFERAREILEYGEGVGNGSYEMAKQLLVAGIVSTDDTTVEFEVQRQTGGEWVPVSRFDNEQDAFKDFDAEAALSPDSVLRLVRQTRAIQEIATTHNGNNDDEE